MMVRLLAAVAATVLALSGCGSAPRAKLDMPFDQARAAELMAPGTNTIKGSALLRQRGGGIVTCAGREVNLVPATEYAKKRMAMIFGSSPISSGLYFEYTPPAYFVFSRTATCNAQGFFTFDKLADGEFFVTTSVTWETSYSTQGGWLMTRFTLAGGETKEVVLTAN